MNQQKQPSDLDLGRDWLERAAFSVDHVDRAARPDALEFARVAAMIGAGYVALAHAERAAKSSATLDAAAERVRRAAAEARPHDDEDRDREARFDAAALDVVARLSEPHDDEPPLHPRTDKDCSRGAFLRLECDLQLDGASVLSLHKVGSDVHLRVWHAGSDEYAVAVLGRAYRRDVVHALTEFDTSEADRG